jgi:starch synthase
MFPTNDWLKDLDLTLNPYRKPPKPEVRDVKPPLAQQFTTQPVPPVIRPTPDSYPIVRPSSERPVRDSSFVASTPTPRSTPVSVPHFATYTPTPVSTPRSVPHTLTPAPHFPTYTPAPVPTTHSVTPTPAPTPHFAIPPPYVPPATRYVAPVVRPITAYVSPTTAPITREAEGRINAYRNAATEAYKYSEAAGRKIGSLIQFMNDLENLSISNDHLVERLKEHVGIPTFNKICEEVAFALDEARNAGMGEHRLRGNFRDILRVKNYDGQNLLEQMVASYSSQLENYKGICELNHLSEILERLNDAHQRAKGTSIGQVNQARQDAAKLQSDAIEVFKGLSGTPMAVVCGKIYEHDGGGDKGPDYGRNIALGDIQRLLLYKEIRPTQHAIAICTINATQPLTFNVSFGNSESITPNNSHVTIGEIRKLYQLEDLSHFLCDKVKNNDFLKTKYLALSPDLSKLLNEAIWIGSYQPNELGYSENLISQHVRTLLSIKNQQGIDIIFQLISHQKEKIKGLKIIDELDSFEKASVNKSPPDIVALFDRLSDRVKDDLRGRVYQRDSSNGSLDGWREFFPGRWGYYGTCKIEADPKTLFHGSPSLFSSYLNSFKEKVYTADATLLKDLKLTKPLPVVPQGPIDVSSSRLIEENNQTGFLKHLPRDLRVAIVTAELAKVASIGGLGSAVQGIAQGMGDTEHVRVIMPLYRKGPIATEQIDTMERAAKYDIVVAGKNHEVYRKEINGIQCYFIDDPELFTIPAGNMYSGDFLAVKYRWAVFQSAAAELVYKFSKKKKEPFQIAHIHEAQLGLIPEFLANRHPEEYREGKTPATLFTFHNNLVQNEYDRQETIEMLDWHGLPRRGRNSLIEGLRSADFSTTVSETFGKEVQTEELGRGIHPHVKEAALKGRLIGIVNGNSNDWNPSTNEQLRDWRSVRSTKREIIDLRFGPKSDDLADTIKTCQRELCAYLKSFDVKDEAYADLDPRKPIVMYVGRYDSLQKGIDKLPLIMRQTLAKGGQFVCIGTDPDDKSKGFLHEMKHAAYHTYGKKGVLILEDRKENGKYKYQDGNAERPGFGALLRAAASLGIFPSIYEPCGLVQGEFHRFGKKVIATATGGFADTVNEENGYLFERYKNWYAPEQDKAIIDTLEIALDEARTMQEMLYSDSKEAQESHIGAMRKIMDKALNSTWDRTPRNPDGSSPPPPIRLYEFAMAKAFANREERGRPISSLDLNTVKV